MQSRGLYLRYIHLDEDGIYGSYERAMKKSERRAQAARYNVVQRD